MKAYSHLPLQYYFYLTIYFVHAVFSGDTSLTTSPDASAACPLNFSSFPYKPTGECIGSQEKVTYWDSYPTTACCRNALTVFSQTLASHASKTQGNIFLEDKQWENCSSYVLRQQKEESNSCHFENLTHGSSYCSTMSLPFVTGRTMYVKAQTDCSNFNYSYEDTCRSCSHAVLNLRDDILDEAKDNDTEKAICGVASVISVAAAYMDDPLWIDSFYRCLPALDKLEPGYVKVRNSTTKVLFTMLIASIGLILVISLIKYMTKNKKPPQPSNQKEFTTWSGLYRFSKGEIENAINFCERKSIGKGSAGEVYKGVLPSGQVVAIKHIYKNNTSDSLKSEVEGLSQVRHPNLVCLFGYCIEGGEQYLVYEYCSSGNLASHLLVKDTLLTWERRVKILRDCALALRYLHHFMDGCIVHRDIKLTNILLTESLEPKLSDFGLAKMLRMDESKVFTDVRGTIGYMDPEYMSNARLTSASDIYSFGIVILQLLSGQKAIELDLDARDHLTRKARDVTMGKRPLSDFEDPRLEDNFNKSDFAIILEVAVFCVAKASKDRPTIDFVCDEMERAWTNTVADTRIKRVTNSSATSFSRSWDVIPVQT